MVDGANDLGDTGSAVLLADHYKLCARNFLRKEFGTGSTETT